MTKLLAMGTVQGAMVVHAVVHTARTSVRRAPRLSHPRASIRYAGEDHCIVWHGSVQIIASNEPPTLQAMARMADELEQLEKSSGVGPGCLLIIRSDVAPPSEEARRFIKMKLEKSSMVAAAQVVLGTGFRGAAMRSMLSLLQLAIRPRFGMRIFGDIDEGCEWLNKQLEGHVSQPVPLDALKRTANEVREQFLCAPA